MSGPPRILAGMVLACALALLAMPGRAEAAYAPLTFRYNHFIFTLDPDDHPAWRSTEEYWTLEGRPFLPPASLRVDGDDIPPLPPGVVRTASFAWDEGAIRATIDLHIARVFDREPGSVTISTAEGAVSFEGVGLPGRRVDLPEAARLTAEALRQGITDISLPVTELQPLISVADPALQDRGIQEVVSVGESDFRGSPGPRQHNIATGLQRFNGHIVPRGATFSFNEVLGPVNAAAGYKKELVIQGDKTLPDYGGGLCQVSTTAYRGVWEYGFPIAQRLNHSYSVRYYFPQGTDATIYPPYKDMQFVNDSPGDLLIQTHVADGRAYFIYYGTRDRRETRVIGPYVWGQTAPPPDKVEHTTDIPPGTSRKVGERVPGLRAGWLRFVRMPDAADADRETYYSVYEARPLYTQIGVTEAELAPPPAPVAEEAPERVQPPADTYGRPSWLTRWRRRD